MLILVIIVMMVVMMLMLLFHLASKLGELGGDAALLLHGFQYLFSCQLIPLRCNDFRIVVERPYHLNASVELILGESRRMAQDNSACILYLVIKELTKVLHIHLAFLCIDDGCKSVQFYFVIMKVFNRKYYIAQFSNARRLYQNSVRRKFLDHLIKSFRKISHERTADATRIHFIYLNSGLLQKTSVNAYITELILDENQFLTRISLFY